jgi:hypothetical protein
VRKKLFYGLLIIYAAYRLFDFAMTPQHPHISDRVFEGSYCTEAETWFQAQYQAAPTVLPPCQ